MRKQLANHTFVLAGNWAYSNLGCEAIVRGTTTLLREAAGDACFISNYFTEEKCTDLQKETDSSIIHRPFPFLRRYSLPWFQNQIERRLFHYPISSTVRNSFHRSLGEASAVLMLGGDTFTPDYGQSTFYFGLSNLAVAQKLPVALWGASIGPFSSDPVYERWAAERLSEITLLCARETETLAYLGSLGLKDNVILTADPSFHLQPLECQLPDEIEMALKGGCIGLNLSPLMHRYISRNESTGSTENSFQMWIKIAAEVVLNLQHRFSQPVLLIPHVFSECGDIERDDYLFLREVAKRVQEPAGLLLLEPGFSAAQTKWVISRVRAFAGSRTHSTLAAISTGVPTICIGYSMKSRGIAKDVYGHLDWLIPGADLVKNPALLGERLALLYDQESVIRNNLQQVIPIFKQRARDATKRFLEMIE